MDPLTIAMFLSQQFMYREAFSALPDAPVVPYVEPVAPGPSYPGRGRRRPVPAR